MAFVNKGQGKEKYPCLGSDAPEMPHCNKTDLRAGGNVHARWYDCKNCNHRVLDVSVLTGVVKYYAVPPCTISANYDPLRPQLTPNQAVEREQFAKIPPLSKAEQSKAMREVKTQPQLTPEEEQLLAAARALLKREEPTPVAATKLRLRIRRPQRR